MYIYKNKNECTGCTLCKTVCPVNAISMAEDSKGFKYPFINQHLCINCNLCKSKCHNLNDTIANDHEQEFYACKNKSLDTVQRSSSGGFFTALSDYVLDNNGIVYGVQYDSSFNAVYKRCTSKDERNLCRGSKYIQSYVDDNFLTVKEDLDKNLLVLFVGTPCQISSLLSYLNPKKYENLITLDFVCHGTPSPGLFKHYIKFFEKERKKTIVNYNHRNLKDMGHNEKAIFSDGTEEGRTRLSSTWKILFYKNLIIRPSCYTCKYTTKSRCSDLTMGDFHGLENIDKDFYDYSGVSLLIVSSAKGCKIVNELDSIHLKKQTYDNMAIKNPQLKNPIAYNTEVDLFWDYYEKNNFKKAAIKFGGYNRIGKLKHVIKSYLGKL